MIQSFLCAASVVVTFVPSAAFGRQDKLRTFQPTPFRARPVQSGSVRVAPSTARQVPSSLKKDAADTGSRNAVGLYRAQVAQQMKDIKEAAQKFEQTTESSVTDDGTIRQSMIEADVDKKQADSVIEAMKTSVPEMREAGKVAREECEKVEKGG